MHPSLSKKRRRQSHFHSPNTIKPFRFKNDRFPIDGDLSYVIQEEVTNNNLGQQKSDISSLKSSKPPSPKGELGRQVLFDKLHYLLLKKKQKMF